MRLFLFLLVFVSASQIGYSQDSLAHTIPDTLGISLITSKEIAKPVDDSVAIQKRSFNESILDNLSAKDDFDYKQPPSVAESLWTRFKIWVLQFFEWLFGNAVATDWGRVALIALGIGVVIFVVMLLLKVDALKVFYSGADAGSLQYHGIEENIHEMDFDLLIKNALEKKEYRTGVRLTFLYALKMLSDKQHIYWRLGKTNHDYLKELSEPELKKGFNELSFYFEYAWYGDFNINEALFLRVQDIFNDWKKIL